MSIVICVIALSLSSYVSVPMVPVPITAQTYVLLVGAAWLGSRRSVVAVGLWLLLGAAGVPVLAGGAAGLERFVGPTAGYLYAFPVAAFIVGALAERGWDARRPGLSFLAMLIGHAVCLGGGGAWLAATIGVEPAVTKGVVPFLPGAVIKSALGVVTLRAVAGRPTDDEPPAP